MKYRSNNPVDRADSSRFIKFDANDKHTCALRRGLTRVPQSKKKKKNWSLRVILASRPPLPPPTSWPMAKKNSIRSKSNHFCDKAEKLISQKRQFRVHPPPPPPSLSPPRVAIYAIIYRHRKRVITFHCSASACNCNRSSQ